MNNPISSAFLDFIREAKLLGLVISPQVMQFAATITGSLITVTGVFFTLRWNLIWNRKATTQKICESFLLDQDLYDCWQKIKEVLNEGRSEFENGTLYDTLEPDQKKAADQLLSFLEGVAILVRNNVVASEIVYDHFCGMIYLLVGSATTHLEKVREERNDRRVNENVEQLYLTILKEEKGTIPSGKTIIRPFQRASKRATGSGGRRLKRIPWTPT